TSGVGYTRPVRGGCEYFPQCVRSQPDAYRDGDGASRRRRHGDSLGELHARVAACVATIRRRLLAVPRPGASPPHAGAHGRGITVDRFAAAGRPLATKVFGTMMRVELPRPLAPNLRITFDIAWHFPIPPYGGGRMGRVGSRFYELGQWYPRMAVYDDAHGWN